MNEAIVPNIVHSFDASNISLIIKTLLENNNNINISTIHDCFSTNCNNVNLMREHVKFAFLLLYLNKNFVEHYNNYILNYIYNSGYIISDNHIHFNEIVKNKMKEKIVKIPEIPKFDYSKDFKDSILGSQYFIN
jgi:DNA-directed RNA polymerase